MTTTHAPSTLLALHDADPEGLNEIGAKLAGWYRCDKQNDCGGWHNDRLELQSYPKTLPPYHTSLDAVAELEAGLTDEEHEEFRQHLWEIVGLPDSDPFDWSMKRNRAYISAPAHLRLIAWVLTKQTI